MFISTKLINYFINLLDTLLTGSDEVDGLHVLKGLATLVNGLNN